MKGSTSANLAQRSLWSPMAATSNTAALSEPGSEGMRSIDRQVTRPDRNLLLDRL